MRVDLNYLIEEAEIHNLLHCLGVLGGYALPETLEACAERLDRYVLPVTEDGMDTYLGFFRAVDNIHRLYEHYFPEEFARSTKSIVPALDDAYSDRECEFFDLVDSRLFPLPWFLQDASGREERWYDLPLVALGREWWNDGVEEWELGWLLLLCLVEGEGEGEILERYPHVAEALLPLSANRGTLAFSLLERDCRRARTPLAYLPEALNILYHDTGSFFLDIYTETPDASLDWTQKDMDLAIVHMRRAIRTTNRANRFITWIDNDPIPRFEEVLTLWNLYCQKKEDNHLRLLALNQPTER